MKKMKTSDNLLRKTISCVFSDKVILLNSSEWLGIYRSISFFKDKTFRRFLFGQRSKRLTKPGLKEEIVEIGTVSLFRV